MLTGLRTLAVCLTLACAAGAAHAGEPAPAKPSRLARATAHVVFQGLRFTDRDFRDQYAMHRRFEGVRALRLRAHLRAAESGAGFGAVGVGAGTAYLGARLGSPVLMAAGSVLVLGGAVTAGDGWHQMGVASGELKDALGRAKRDTVFVMRNDLGRWRDTFVQAGWIAPEGR